MQRRSNSLSHIPVRLYGNTANKEVAAKKKTHSRLTQYTESNLLKPKRSTSLDRKSSLMKLTPLQRQGSYVKDRFTPGSSRKSSLSSRISPGSGLRDRPTIQKLSSDKKWVAEQYAKVQRFINESSLFDDKIITPTNIKPPSIKGFVYLVTVLFKQLFHSVKLTQENYKEEVVKKLKLLNYPGNMTISTLKSVNTMHSWPQVIGMCAWLIQQIELTETGTIDSQMIPEDELYKYESTEMFRDYILERCEAMNGPNAQDQINDLDSKFVMDFPHTIGFNPDNEAIIRAEYEEKMEHYNNIMNDLRDQEAKHESLRSKKDQLIRELEDFESTESDREAALNAELEYYRMADIKKGKMEEELKSNVSKLERNINNHPYTYQQKTALLEECQSLKNEVNIAKDTLQHAYDIKKQYDEKIDEIRDELQSKVLAWNRSLMAVSVEIPILKNLLLKETALYRNEFLTEIHEVAKNKIETEREFAQHVDSMEINTHLVHQISNLKSDLEDLANKVNQLTAKSKEFNEKDHLLQANIKQMLIDQENMERTYMEAMNSPFADQINQLNNENESLGSKKEEFSADLKKLSENGVAFFLEVCRQANDFVKEKNKIIKEKKEQCEEVLRKELEDVLHIREMLENLKKDDVPK